MPESFPQSKIEKTETESNFENWLNFEIPKQYWEQIQILNRLGIIGTINAENAEHPIEMEKGITGIDNQKYAIPRLEDIQNQIRENQEKFETKRKQGFSEIQITPFALPLKRLIEIAKKQLLKHYQEKKLFIPKINPNDPDIPFDLDPNDPFWKWDSYDNADIEGKIIYDAEQFNKTNHKGKIKKQILEDKNQRFSGFRVTLQEKNLIIPREGKGRTIGGRKQIEANLKPEEYLKKMLTDPQYTHEQGLTPEEWIIKLLINLEKFNQVLDVYDSNNENLGSYCYLLGGYFPASGDVSGACCFRDNRRAGLNGRDPASRDSYRGCRGTVRV